MNMSWRNFILLCVGIIWFFAYITDPSNSPTGIDATHDDDESITTVSGTTYPLVPLALVIETEGFPATNRLTHLCGKYFYTVRFSNEEYVGFGLLLPVNDSSPLRVSMMLFPRKSYIVVPFGNDPETSPTVEFNNANIIIRLNQADLTQSSCFKNRMLI